MPIKRIVQLITAICIVFLVATSATAFFEDSHLVLVVYNEADNEVAVDLGNMETLTLDAQNLELAPAGSVASPGGPSSQFGVTINSWSDLRAAYFTAYMRMTAEDTHLIFATTSGSLPDINTTSALNFFNGSGPCHTYWSGAGTRVFVGPSSNVRSYDFKLNGNSTVPGQMAGYNVDYEEGETDLSALETVGYVDMYLYGFDYNGNSISGTGGDHIAVLRFNADGGVVLNPSGGNSPPSIQLLRNGQPITGNLSVDEGESLSVVVRADDEENDSISLTSPTANQLPDGSELTGPTVDGSVYQWTFNWTPGTNQSGTVPLNFTVDDGAASNSQSLSIEVNDLNQTPSISVSGPDSVDEGEEIVLSIEASDLDGDSLSLSTGSLPDGVLLTGPEVNGDNYQWTFSWTPDFNQAGSYPFEFNVTDGTSPATANKSISVVNINQQPTLDNISNQILEDPANELTMSITARDEDEVGLNLSFEPLSHGSLPGSYSADLDSVDGETGLHTWTFRWTPGNGVADIYRIGFTVTENSGAAPMSSNVVEAVITVGDTSNLPPELQSIGAKEAAEATTLVIQLAADDPDEGQTLAYAVELPDDMPNGHNAHINESTGEFTWTVQVGDGQETSHVYNLTFHVTDDGSTSLSDNETISVTVYENRIPGTPAINNPPDEGLVNTNQSVELSVSNAADPDTNIEFGQVLQYTFQVSTEQDMSAIIAESGDVAEGPGGASGTTEWVIPTNLTDDTTYYWGARVFDGIENSQWVNGSFTVNVENSPPGDPTIISPQNNALVSSTTPELLIQNAVDPDGDSLTYKFQIGSSSDMLNIVVESDPVDEGNNHSGTDRTSWITPELNDITQYWWWVRAEDSQGAVGNWIGPYSFTLNTANGLSAPGLDPEWEDQGIYGGEVSTDRPKLVISNIDHQEITGDIVYYFEIVPRIDGGCNYDDEELVQSATIPEGQMEAPLPGDDDGWGSGIGGVPQDPDHTGWKPEVLDDETNYCWRVQALNENGDRGPFVESTVFVNLENNLPTAAAIKSPVHNSKIGEKMPTLEVYPATDSDEDRISYQFFIYDESDQLVEDSGPMNRTEWQVPVALADGTWYWQVKTFDEHADESGEPNRWSEKAQFTVKFNDQPGVPTDLTPSYGAIIEDLRPTLRLTNAVDEDGEPLEYEFEIYNDQSLAVFSFVASAVIEEGEATTSWELPEPLADNMTYYWRVRALDNEYYGAWTETMRFKVDTSGALLFNVEASKQVFASLEDEQIVEVLIEDSPIYGTRVIIPPGALSENITMTISYVQNPPIQEDEYLVIGKVLDLGPHGTVFSQPVTIEVPYTQEDLEAIGIDSSGLIKVYYYDEDEETWEELDITSVDEENKIINCTLDHFSIYLFGISREDSAHSDPQDDSPSSGDSSGSCFIKTLPNYDNTLSQTGVLMLVVGIFFAVSIRMIPAKKK